MLGIWLSGNREQAIASSIYKIVTREAWARAQADGVYAGSGVDEEDGFIHLSSGGQVRETAAKHFAGQADLVLLTVDATRCPRSALRWEPSRGGQLFPHLYVPLDPAWVVGVDDLPLERGSHCFPRDVGPSEAPAAG